MKKTTYVSLLAVLMLWGCSKSADDLTLNKDENQLQSAKNTTVSARTATPISTNLLPYWDNNDVLQTSVWYPPSFGTSIPDNQYNYSQFPGYDYSPYLINEETDYNPGNYDVMLHFGYFSPVDVDDAVVEFTFPQIKNFVPHITNSLQASTRIYSVNNVDNQTVVTCITDLKKAYYNTATPARLIGSPMFCFIVKADCNNNRRNSNS